MAARSLRKRTAIAGLLVGAAIAGLLAAWFSAGWGELRAKRDAIEAGPRVAAEERQRAMAAQLRGELERMIHLETDRPYYHYQNLFHDPKSGNQALSVAPSPLATEPENALVRGYFQFDSKGVLSVPTINDEAPELSDQKHLVENRVFRDSVQRDLANVGEAAMSSSAEIAENRPVKAKPPVATPALPRPHVRDKPIEVAQAEVVRIDNNSYTQNNIPTQIYQQQAVNPPQQAVRVATPVINAPRQKEYCYDAPPTLPKLEVPAPDVVTVSVSSFEWETYEFEGRPTLLAVREVRTPDGAIEQGFVLDHTTLSKNLASAAGDMVATMIPDQEGPAESVVVPEWRLEVMPNPRALVAAAGESRDAMEAFVMRFTAVGVLAVVAGVLAVMFVARAERMALERSQFAAAAAHELRTPLAGLQLYGDMLADGLGDRGKQTDYAKRMSEEASRLGRVVSNVLGFSQLERGNLSLAPKVGDLSGALRELAERAEPALDRAGAVLELDVAPDLSARFDRDALARIVGNLIDNAEKYGREAEDRTITLSARHVSNGGVEVAVTDRGPGVSAKDRAKLFKAFSRAVKGTDGPAGLGLGLALSRSLAEAMGGGLEYREGKEGATFVLSLAAG